MKMHWLSYEKEINKINVALIIGWIAGKSMLNPQQL